VKQLGLKRHKLVGPFEVAGRCIPSPTPIRVGMLPKHLMLLRRWRLQDQLLEAAPSVGTV